MGERGATHAGKIGESMRGHLHDGWLTFDAVDERRRLSPIPEDWSIASPTVLEAYCESAAA